MCYNFSLDYLIQKEIDNGSGAPLPSFVPTFSGTVQGIETGTKSDMEKIMAVV